MKLIEVVDCNTFFQEHGTETLTLFKDNVCGFYDCSINNRYTNMGFRLAYFLWIMRGSNNLSELSFYSKHVNKMTDDHMTLRGAYGPRLRYWVGPDQLQEAIKKNQDIDKEEDMVKPEGIDQLRMVYRDLKAGQKIGCCQIFDPSLDFDDSNDIPDLNCLMFSWGEKLHLSAIFGRSTLNTHFINDYFFLSLLHICISNILGAASGNLNCIVQSASIKYSTKFNSIDMSNNEKIVPNNNSPESLWEDIYGLCELERHLRTAFTKDAIDRPTVNLHEWCDLLIEKFIDTRSCQFWKDYGLTLMAYVLTLISGNVYKEYVAEKCFSKIKSGLKNELELVNGKVV